MLPEVKVEIISVNDFSTLNIGNIMVIIKERYNSQNV